MEKRKRLKYYWEIGKEKCLKTVYSLKYVIALAVAIVLWCPAPSSEHYVWPLSMCIFADLCNHSWIPECGFDNSSSQYRIFIDECDMFEYNCDHNYSFIVKNYSECFMFPPTCPTNFYMRGNYKYVPDGRRILYAPTQFPHTHHRPAYHHERRTPNLPKRMLEGKRRYTPEKLKPYYRRFMATSQRPTQPTTRLKRKFKTKPITVTFKIVRTRGTLVLQRITIFKNGRKLVKIIKGFITDTGEHKRNLMRTTELESDFLQ